MRSFIYTERLDNALNEWFKTSTFRYSGWTLSDAWSIGEHGTLYDTLFELCYVHPAGEDVSDQWDTITAWWDGSISFSSSWDERFPQLCADELRELAKLSDIIHEEYERQR